MNLFTHTARFDWLIELHCNQPAHRADFALVSLDLEYTVVEVTYHQDLQRYEFKTVKMEMAKRIELERRGRKEEEVCVFWFRNIGSLCTCRCEL